MRGPPRRGPAYKTKLCAVWQRGGCSNDTCSFAHGKAELRQYPGSRTSFPPRRGCGRRDYRGEVFRNRFDRRRSPHRRYSPESDSRCHRSLHNRRPTSQERESSYSRSPSRKSERRHEKKPDDGETNSSRSMSVSDNNDDRSKDKFSSGNDKEDHEKQLKLIRDNTALLRDDKSHLEIILEEKNAEVRKVLSRINDLDLQLKKEKEECHRMTSKVKKFIKAHGRFLKAQEELKRSQARFERLGDLLASDILKRGANEEGSSIDVDEDPSGYERNPNSAAPKKKSILYSTSEEAKAVKKRRERDSDTVLETEKCKSEGTVVELDKQNKGSETTKSLYLKKRLWADKLGNVASLASADKVRDSPVKHVLPSTGMAAHSMDDPIEAVELEGRHEPMDAALENDADEETRLPAMPPCSPPMVNAYKQSEGGDLEVDVN